MQNTQHIYYRDDTKAETGLTAATLTLTLDHEPNPNPNLARNIHKYSPQQFSTFYQFDIRILLDASV